MTSHEVVILGGHGDGLVAANIIADLNAKGLDIRLSGYLNDHAERGDTIAGYPVLGKTADWHHLPASTSFHCCLLSVGKMAERSALIEGFAIPDERLISLIHPTACLADGVSIGVGSLVAAYAIFQPGTKTGRYCSIRGGANLGHDSEMSDFSYVGPNATLCGYASLGRGAYVGPNAVVRDRTGLGDFAVLAAGSVAYRDLPANSTWIGNPAKRAT